MRCLIFYFFLMLGISSCGAAFAGGSAADAIAQKFAVDEQKLAPRTAPAQPAQNQVKAAAAAKPRPATSAPPVDDEQEMLAAARAEAEARKGKDTPAPAKPAVTAAQEAATAAKTNAPPNAQPAKAAGPAKATVLVVLTPNAAGSSAMKSFDPVICLGAICYVSTGPASEARALPRDQALSTKNSIADGAGACAGMPGCAFRGVTVEPGAGLQVIDLGLAQHEVHETLAAGIDATCALDGQLICHKPAAAPDYRVWIVPEALAAQAGPDKLDEALGAELPEENVTLETDK